VLHARPRVLRASADELSQHEQRLDALDKSSVDGQSVWRRLG
jgi:DNA polymerase III subunit epsilon